MDTAVVQFDYTYDLAGRLAQKDVTNDSAAFKTLKYAFYPGTNLLATVQKGDNSAYTEITQYSPQGKIVFMNHANNTVTNYIYDDATARISVINSYSDFGSSTTLITDKAYTYSKAGDVTRIVNGRTGITYEYAYDYDHRLISELSSGDNAVAGTRVEVIEFNYDDEPGTPVHAPAKTIKNGVETNYTYTATGNRMGKQAGLSTSAYESNDDNMISKITIDGVETSFFYDADNKRVKKVQGYAVTRYFGDNMEIINDTPNLYIFAGNLRVAKTTDTDTVWFHKDHLNSTEALSREALLVRGSDQAIVLE